MKYLYCGTLCSESANCFSENTIKWIGWTGGLGYFIFMIAGWCIMMATFPGYEDETKNREWETKIYFPIYYSSYIVWAVYNMVGVLVTVVGI